MQPHEKSVKLFADCLFSLSGSGKPFLQISTNSSRPKAWTSHLILGRN